MEKRPSRLWLCDCCDCGGRSETVAPAQRQGGERCAPGTFLGLVPARSFPGRAVPASIHQCFNHNKHRHVPFLFPSLCVSLFFFFCFFFPLLAHFVSRISLLSLLFCLLHLIAALLSSASSSPCARVCTPFGPSALCLPVTTAVAFTTYGKPQSPFRLCVCDPAVPGLWRFLLHYIPYFSYSSSSRPGFPRLSGRPCLLLFLSHHRGHTLTPPGPSRRLRLLPSSLAGPGSLPAICSRSRSSHRPTISRALFLSHLTSWGWLAHSCPTLILSLFHFPVHHNPGRVYITYISRAQPGPATTFAIQLGRLLPALGAPLVQRHKHSHTK